MALFDKLKEKVNKVVDVDKLSEMATKTVDSIKHEVVKAIDPTVKEQERLENERIKEQERLKKEQEHLENERALQAQKEKALEDFLLSINLDDELNYIFSVLEKSGASAITFEKGVEHLLSKNETNLTKSEVLPVLKKELLARAFADNEYAVPMVIAIDYFISDVVKDKLLPLYVRFTVSREGGSYAVMEVPFVKALYGIAGRAFNYLNNKLEQKNYQLMTPDNFIPIIEDSDTLKSYTDEDPFTADEVRNTWAKDLYNSPLELVHSSKLRDLLDREEYVDALYYFTYTTLCQDQEDSVKNVNIAKIASIYLDYLQEYYNRIKR